MSVVQVHVRVLRPSSRHTDIRARSADTWTSYTSVTQTHVHLLRPSSPHMYIRVLRTDTYTSYTSVV